VRVEAKASYAARCISAPVCVAADTKNNTISSRQTINLHYNLEQDSTT
jgi:hypothetical protein